MKKKEDLKALFYPNVPFDTLFIPYIYKEIYLDGIYTDIFNQRLEKSMVIVDVGANIGIVTQYMQPYAKKLYAIEPSSEHFEALKKNKEFNDWDNVEVFKMALADKDGEVTLLKNVANRTMNTIQFGLQAEGSGAKYKVMDNAHQGYTEPEKVKTMAMDTFFKENGVDEVDFMKFDVEGAEDMILRSEGFKKVAPKVKNIEVEFHFPNWMELVEYMVSLGYQARRYDCSAIVVLFFR